jgi:hypothetical protein
LPTLVGCSAGLVVGLGESNLFLRQHLAIAVVSAVSAFNGMDN